MFTHRFFIQFAIFYQFICILFSQSDASIAVKSSIPLLQFPSTLSPILHLGVKQNNNDIQPVGGLQIHPSNNLILGGGMSLKKNVDHLELYYQLCIGYIPKWKKFKSSYNIIKIAMHRYRFHSEGDARWFNLSVMELIQMDRLNLNIAWNRFFTHQWTQNTISISTNLKLIHNINLLFGTSVFFTPEFDYSPFIIINSDL